MDQIPNMNSTIRSQLFEYQIIRIIRCNSEGHVTWMLSKWWLTVKFCFGFHDFDSSLKLDKILLEHIKCSVSFSWNISLKGLIFGTTLHTRIGDDHPPASYRHWFLLSHIMSDWFPLKYQIHWVWAKPNNNITAMMKDARAGDWSDRWLLLCELRFRFGEKMNRFLVVSFLACAAAKQNSRVSNNVLQRI